MAGNLCHIGPYFQFSVLHEIVENLKIERNMSNSLNVYFVLSECIRLQKILKTCIKNKQLRNVKNCSLY